MTYKIGDKVSFQKHPDNWTGYPNRESGVGIIAYIHNGLHNGCSRREINCNKPLYTLYEDIEENKSYYGMFHEGEISLITEEPKFKVNFQIGDRVRVIKPILSDNMGDIGTITKIDNSSVPYKIDDNYWASEVEKINKPKSFRYIPNYFPELATYNWNYQKIKISTNESLTQKAKKTMNNLVSKLKDLTLTKEERILREQGLEDEHGEMTGQAISMMHEEMEKERWASRRKEIAKDLLKLKEEEK